jgi:hypothetical protein
MTSQRDEPPFPYLEHATAIASGPLEWLRRAGGLKASADILWERVDTFYDHAFAADEAAAPHRSAGTPQLIAEMRTASLLGPPISLLMGLCIENLAKALFVQSLNLNNEVVVENQRLIKRLTDGHDAIRILAEAGVGLDELETDLCERLEECVLWAGRYPVPKNLPDYAPPPQGRSRAVPEAPLRLDKSVFDALVVRLWLAAEERDPDRALRVLLGVYGMQFR